MLRLMLGRQRTSPLTPQQESVIVIFQRVSSRLVRRMRQQKAISVRWNWCDQVIVRDRPMEH